MTADRRDSTIFVSWESHLCGRPMYFARTADHHVEIRFAMCAMPVDVSEHIADLLGAQAWSGTAVLCHGAVEGPSARDG